MRTWGWGIALLGVLSATIASAQPPKNKQLPPGWWRDMLNQSKPKEEVKQPDARAKKPDATAKAPEAGVETPPVNRSAELERLQNALMRRVEVCDRLREIAQATGNDSLLSEADRLEELAERAHRQQSARLGLRVRSMAGDPLPESLATPPVTPMPVNGLKGGK